MLNAVVYLPLPQSPAPMFHKVFELKDNNEEIEQKEIDLLQAKIASVLNTFHNIQAKVKKVTPTIIDLRLNRL